MSSLSSVVLTLNFREGRERPIVTRFRASDDPIIFSSQIQVFGCTLTYSCLFHSCHSDIQVISCLFHSCLSDIQVISCSVFTSYIWDRTHNLSSGSLMLEPTEPSELTWLSWFQHKCWTKCASFIYLFYMDVIHVLPAIQNVILVLFLMIANGKNAKSM